MMEGEGSGMELKQLVANERSEKRERVRKETDGAHILFYLAFIFNVGVSLLYGFETGNSTQDYKVYWYLVIGTVICYIGFNKYLFLVKENGKICNIFEKYQYVPVDVRKLYLAKAIVAGRNIMGQTFLCQLASLFIVIVNPGNEGGSITDFHVWIPSVIGIIALMIFLLVMFLALNNVKRNK